MKNLPVPGKKLTRRELKKVNGGKTKKAFACNTDCGNPHNAQFCLRELFCHCSGSQCVDF